MDGGINRYMNKKITSIIALLNLVFLVASAQTNQDEEMEMKELEEYTISVKHEDQSLRSVSLATNTEVINSGELLRAACCNLGESFTTNPSVDANYSDAATGARQIKLLGLSGTYVQMLTENVPNYRGAAIPYSLSYVPGTWMQSIQVSKGAASVKNGYESITGQINIEFWKPQGIEGIWGNLFLGSDLKWEANAYGTIHINDVTSTNLLLHIENSKLDHDGNQDGFLDKPKMEQYNLQNRWAWITNRWISQLSIKGLHEVRESGMSEHHKAEETPFYGIGITTNRIEAFWKNAFFVNKEKNGSVALILAGSYHNGDQKFGNRIYEVTQGHGYAQLLFEEDLSEHHNLSVGGSFNYDYVKDNLMREDFMLYEGNDPEYVPGAYAQYTYKLGDKLSVLAGIRWDYSSLYKGFFTPRFHIKYMPIKWFTLRASAGKGYRSPHILAENPSVLASNRTLIMGEPYQEEAWNMGGSLTFAPYVGSKKMNINLDYYHTNFIHQLVMDMESAQTVMFYNLMETGKSYSHTLQVDVSYPVWQFNLLAAFRWQDVKQTLGCEMQKDGTLMGGVLKERPLTSRYKGLFTLSWKDNLELWQADLTLQLNGGGRMPAPYLLQEGQSLNTEYTDEEGQRWSWQPRYKAFPQLNVQLSREFRHFTVYVGGENLTNFKQKNPIVDASQPFAPEFDATMVWGPTHGAMAYAGLRFKFEKQTKDK